MKIINHDTSKNESINIDSEQCISEIEYHSSLVKMNDKAIITYTVTPSYYFY